MSDMGLEAQRRSELHRHDGRVPERRPRRSSVPVASLWMVGLSLVLFFIPGVNGLVGGLVGGYKVGGVGRALIAAILPAIVVGIGLWVLLAAFELPIVGFVAGAAIGILVLFADLGLFLGALVGGLAGRHRV